MEDPDATFSPIERIVTFVANIITIIVFVGAITGLIDPKFVPDFTPASHTSANIVLILFACLWGYGSASIIKNRIERSESFGFLVIFCCVIFCVSTIYLEAILVNNLSADDALHVTQSGRLFAGFIYPTIHFIMYMFKIWFPNKVGFFQILTSAFRSGYYVAMGNLIFYLITIPYLFVTLSDNFRH